ncbi:MAG: hypothetical protein JNL60_08680 [Bacteroidia bacterium]|nr:hypothetical protein [Bacteroidia bacterium]
MFQLLLYLLKLLAVLVFGAGTIVMLRSAIVHKRKQKDSKTYIVLTVVFAIITLFIWNYDLTESLNSVHVDKEKVTTETTLMLQNYYEDVRKNGLLAEFKYLDSTNDFYWTPPGFSGPINFDSVSKLLRMNTPTFKSVTNVFDSLKISAMAHDSASYNGLIDSRMIDTSGNETHVKLRETGLLIKRKDGWKLLRGKTTVVE